MYKTLIIEYRVLITWIEYLKLSSQLSMFVSLLQTSDITGDHGVGVESDCSDNEVSSSSLLCLS